MLFRHFSIFLLVGLVTLTSAQPEKTAAEPAPEPEKVPAPTVSDKDTKDREEKPADPTAKPEKSSSEKSDTKLSTNEKAGVTVTSQSWDTYLTSTNAIGTIALLLIGGLGYYYYVYVLKYGYGYNPNQLQYGSYQHQQPYPYQVARSLETSTTTRFNWNQILAMIAVAQESYEKFDFQSLDCQKKCLCELAREREDFGGTGFKVFSKRFTQFDFGALWILKFLYIIDDLPMPTIILNYLNHYKAAIDQIGDCSTIYKNCTFSVKELFGKYYEKRADIVKVEQVL